MAKVYVDDATVEKLFQTQHGWGMRVTETRRTRDGESRKDTFTLWFKDRPDVEEGWKVSASGYLSTRVREFESNGETRHTVDVSLNGARLTSAVAQQIDPYASDGEVF